MHRKPRTASSAARLEKLKGPLKGAKLPQFKQAEAVVLLMNEYGITDATSKTPIIGSPGATACLLIALYDSKQKRAVYAHADQSSLLSSLQEALGYLSLPDTVAHLAGGNESPELCWDAIEFLESNGIRIVNAHIDFAPLSQNFSESHCASFALDARDGSIYAPVATYLRFPEDTPKRFELTALNLYKKGPVPMVKIVHSLEEQKKTRESTVPLMPKASPSKTPQERSFPGLKPGFLKSATREQKKPTEAVALHTPRVPPSTTQQGCLFPGIKPGFLKQATVSTSSVREIKSIPHATPTAQQNAPLPSPPPLLSSTLPVSRPPQRERLFGNLTAGFLNKPTQNTREKAVLPPRRPSLGSENT